MRCSGPACGGPLISGVGGPSSMFTIRYSHTPPEVELAATASEFERLAVSLAELAGSETSEAFIALAVSNPQPYQRSLSGLRLSRTAGPLSATVEGTTLSISGAAPALALLGRCLPVESRLPAGYHIHFEAAGREDLVSPGSVPIILAVAASPDG